MEKIIEYVGTLGVFSYNKDEYIILDKLETKDDCQIGYINFAGGEYIKYIGKSNKPNQLIGCTNISGMFSNLDMEELDLSDWDMFGILNMHYLFAFSEFGKITLPDLFITEEYITYNYKYISDFWSLITKYMIPNNSKKKVEDIINGVYVNTIKKFKVITLCGSTKFKDEFINVQKDLTLNGYIVISVGLFGHSGDDEVWTDDKKEMLDRMHMQKINMADEIFVINVGGYIGDSTMNEIFYAVSQHKIIKYLENVDVCKASNDKYYLTDDLNNGCYNPYTKKEIDKIIYERRTLEEVK